MPLEIDPRDLDACRAILRAGSKSFALASRLLPRAVRDPTAALYAFFREADDAVDEARDARRALDEQRARLDRVFRATGRDPVERALGAVVASFRLPRAPFDALFEGFAWDVDGLRYETLGDVEAYAARVAGTVGVLMTIVMGPRSASVLARACDLGVAMQLTNIARDVGEDAARGRLYLPREWLRSRDLDPDAWLARPRPCKAIAEATASILASADELYARADAGIAMLPARCRLSVRVARLVYADIGRAVARARYDSVSSRATVSLTRKLWLLASAIVPRTAPRATPKALGSAAALIAACADRE